MLVAWTGQGAVGGGVSVLHFGSTSMAGNPAAVLAFFNSIKNFFTSDTVWTVPSSGDVIDDETGLLISSWASPGGGTVAGAATGHNYAEAVGLRIKWDTATVLGGHHLVGSTFLTSFNAVEYQNDGTVQDGTVAAVQAAGTTLIGAATNFRIWMRPRKADPTHVPPIAARGGGSANVVTAIVPDKISWLKSRRT